MSGGKRCSCGRRDAWWVTALRCNRSAFNGYRWTPSEWSEVQCNPAAGGCGAAYVDELPRRG